MGTIKRGILGGFSGKVANVVGSSWKGIAVMKSMPLSVANPRTAKQVAQREDFAAAVALAALILSDWIKPFWDRWAVKMSGFNAFMQENIGRVSTVAGETYNNFVFSKGKMPAATGITFELASYDDPLIINFDDHSGEGLQLEDDAIMSFGFGNDLSKILKQDSAHDRFYSAVELSGDENFVAGDVYVIALSFRRKDGTVVSDSNTIIYTVPVI